MATSLQGSSTEWNNYFNITATSLQGDSEKPFQMLSLFKK